MKLPILLALPLMLLCASCSVANPVAPTPVLTSTPTEVPTITPTPSVCVGEPMPTHSLVSTSTPVMQANPEISKDQQLKVLDSLSSIVTEEYLYPDFNGLDWPTTVARYRAQVQAGLDTETFYAEMDKLVAELNDTDSAFYSPLDYASLPSRSGGKKASDVGIGIVRVLKKDKIVIQMVLPGSPAERAGLKDHDSILAIDGLPIIQDGVDTSLRLIDVQCSAVTLSVQSPGEQARDVTILRQGTPQNYPVISRLLETADGSRIGYISLPLYFMEYTPAQVEKALIDFGSLNGLILDARINQGGDYQSIYTMMGHFTSGTIGHFVSRYETTPVEITPQPLADYQDVPLVVLIDTERLDYHQIFFASLQAMGRARVVGSASSIKARWVRTSSTLADDSTVEFLYQRFEPITKVDWSKPGFIPDAVVEADWDTFTFETDPFIAAALKLLQ